MRASAEEIIGLVEYVEDDLKVKMRWPPAIFLCIAEQGDLLSRFNRVADIEFY